MATELKIEKTEIKTAMEASVISKSEEKAEGTLGRKQRGRDQDLFFTLNERDVKQPQKKDKDDFRDRVSKYGNQGIKSQLISKEIIKDKKQISLGQILCHVFEKAINVQFQEFQNRLTNQMKEFFFRSSENNMFNQDLKLAGFWKDLSPDEQTQFWAKVSKM